MSDINEVAALLYDHPTSREVAAEQAQSSADKPAPPTPSGEHDKANTEAKALNAIYSTEAYREVTLVDEKGTLDEDPAKIAEANEVHRDQMWALQLSEPEAIEYTSLLRNAQTFTDEDRASWPKQQEDILARWTLDERRERLDTVAQWLRRSPGLAQQIVDAKLVGNPRLLKVALEKSWSAKARGDF